MITREHYIKKIREFYDSDLIKIITGIRRCGKSVILNQVIAEIKKKSKNVIYLNFEDKKTISNINTADKLIDYVESNKKDGKCYVFLDEVQEVSNWYEACKTLRLSDISVFIAGSNSKLLSKEFTKELSGRYVSFRIRPFVYKEITEYCKELNRDFSIIDYLIWGGFPKRFEFNTDEARNTYLSYLEEAYIIEKIKPYSTKTKSELKYYYKMYNADVAFNSIRCMDNRFDLTHNLENIVYNELIYRGYNLNVYYINNTEIDFIANKDGKKYYIQVAYSVEDDKAYNRELRPFSKLDNMDKNILITNDEIDYSTSTVTHIKLNDFLNIDSLDEI